MTTFIVCGMHRSGTSATGRVLFHLGLPTGYPLLGPDAHNSLGHYEVAPITTFNDNLMRRFSGHWFEPPEALDTQTQILISRESTGHTAAKLWDNHMPKGDCYVKCPRFSFLLPFWREVIEGPIAVIVCMRAREAVKQSLLKRQPFLFNSKHEERDAVLNDLIFRHWKEPIKWCREHGVPSYISSYSTLTTDRWMAVAGLSKFLYEHSDWQPQTADWLQLGINAIDPNLNHHLEVVPA